MGVASLFLGDTDHPHQAISIIGRKAVGIFCISAIRLAGVSDSKAASDSTVGAVLLQYMIACVRVVRN